ncbi:MAG: aldo/keto reductase [Chloroherpetonaceae bacterium]|nr:aldo/keto reductase [Chthonomonadaceae bacterium]MDW8207178.1 aldo/keto reductase [Chloroherpetonaceae bacterium]
MLGQRGIEKEVRVDREVLQQPMPRRILQGTGWEASVLTLGGVRWPETCNDAEAVALVHRAIELGVNTFDTAHTYCGGESERKLGMALEGVRAQFWINTKVIDRTYDGAMRQMETSLQRLRTDYVDLMFVHSLDNEEQYHQIMAPNSVLRAIEELRAAGHIRYVGVSGHWVRDVLARILQEYAFDAVLFPVGVFNLAYEYSFLDTVLPVARARQMATLGMKVYGAGRIKHARSIVPYLRYSLHQPVDTLVIGADSVTHLEQTVHVIKQELPPLSEPEIHALLPEALQITQSWDAGEFNYVQGYLRSG